MRRWRRWLWWGLNLCLVGLYLWSLTETVEVTLSVVAGECTAELSGRHITIPCGGLEDGWFGLVQDELNGDIDLLWSPLAWLAQRPGWVHIQLADNQGRLVWQEYFARSRLDQTWQSTRGEWNVWGDELRPRTDIASLQRPLNIANPFTLSARIRRPDETMGLLLLRSDGRTGYAFLLLPGSNSSGMWYEWADGQTLRPLIGIPFDKPFLSELQIWLRHVLAAHQGALLVLLAARLLAPIAIWWQKRRTPLNIPARSPFYASRVTVWGLRLSLLLFSFALITFIARGVLEGIPHVQDSLTYLFQAQTLARGRVTAPAPPLPDFFEQEFMLVQGGHWFGKYSPGYPILLAVGVWVGVPWLVNPLLATLTIALLVALSRIWLRVQGEKRASHRYFIWLAAAFCLSSPFFLFLSGSYMAHAAELFWGTLLMWTWIRGLTYPIKTPVISTPFPKSVRTSFFSPRTLWFIVAGIALGMLWLTRQYAAAAFAIPFILLSLWATRPSTPRPPLPASSRFLASISASIRPLLVLGFTGLPFVILLFAYQFAVTGSPWQDPRLLFWPFDRPGFGADIGLGSNVIEIEILDDLPVLVRVNDPTLPPRGHTPARGLHNVIQNWRQLNVHLFGWLPFLTLAFVWLAFMMRPPERLDWALLGAFLVLLVAHVAYWHSGIMYGPRYLYIALPALLLLTVRGLVAAADWLNQYTRQSVGYIVMGVIVAGLVAGNLFLYLPDQFQVHQGYNFISRAGLDAVEEVAVTPALVFVAADSGLWWEYGQFFSGNTPWLDGDILYARDLGTTANEALITLYPGYHLYRFSESSLQPYP